MAAVPLILLSAMYGFTGSEAPEVSALSYSANCEITFRNTRVHFEFFLSSVCVYEAVKVSSSRPSKKKKVIQVYSSHLHYSCGIQRQELLGISHYFIFLQWITKSYC
jgi:hypothetical protein